MKSRIHGPRGIGEIKFHGKISNLSSYSVSPYVSGHVKVQKQIFAFLLENASSLSSFVTATFATLVTRNKKRGRTTVVIISRYYLETVRCFSNCRFHVMYGTHACICVCVCVRDTSTGSGKIVI